MTPTETQIRLERALAAAGGTSSDFDLNPEFAPPKTVKLRAAGVLVAIDTSGEEPSVILTKRAPSLKHHPGQIAFAGGKVEPGDNGSEINAALREAKEEIGLPGRDAQVLGVLPAHQTVTGFMVVPVVAMVGAKFREQPQSGEVAEIFRVPLAHFLDAQNYAVQWRFWGGQKRHYFVVPYGPYYVWGATARMMRVLCDRMAKI